jgi:hypothetical protein
MTLQIILAAVLALGAPKETATDVAVAIAKYARTPDEAAFMAAWARHESEFSAAIAAGKCEKWQCDAHKLADGRVVFRARGLWQLHRGAAGDDWEMLPGDIDAQARAAARMTRWALRQCPGDPVRGGFRVLGGLGCQKALRGEAKRVASFEKARRAVQ